jgi:hypothetical protein
LGSWQAAALNVHAERRLHRDAAQPKLETYKFRNVVESCLSPSQINHVVDLVDEMDKKNNLSELISHPTITSDDPVKVITGIV